MSKYLRLSVLSLLAIVFLTAAAPLGGGSNAHDRDFFDIKDTVKRSFKVRPGGTLALDIDRGNVKVRPGSAREVLVEVERTVTTDERSRAERVFEKHDLVIEEQDGGVHVKSRYDREEGFWGRIRSTDRLKVRILVVIPEEYDVRFVAGAGNISIGNLSGRIHGRTGAGNIHLGPVRGSVDIASGSGNIVIEGAEGHAEVNTGAGNVDIRSLDGAVSVHTGAGNIEVTIVEQLQEASNLMTGAGNVSVFLSRDVGVEVNAECAVGSARTDYPLTVESKWTRKTFAGSVNGGGPSLRLYAGVGNVELRKR